MIISYEQASKLSKDLVGTKALNISKLSNHFNIPAGVVITTDAYDAFQYENIGGPQNTSLPLSIENQLQEAVGCLSSKYFCVRSSAANEDSDIASFAGQYDSYFGIEREALPQYVIKIYRSVFSEKAIAYKEELRLPLEDQMAILIQELIPCEKSGIIFTANPVNRHLSEMVIEAGWGLGLYIVSGSITPYHYKYELDTGNIMGRSGNQKEALFFKNGKLLNLERTWDKEECLNSKEIELLASTAKQVENIFGAPQDIEWGMYGGELYIFQTRRITTL